jgi:catechol 2,3-dioxygenase-like lactoylglutathione lyase family enzyme
MQIKGLVWAGTRTDRAGEMAAFCRDVLGLRQTWDSDGVAMFDLPNGDRFELFSAQSSHNPFQTGVMAGFLVDDVDGARAELERHGVEIIGPVHRNSEGYVWTNFVAPDGNVYSLTYFPGHGGD